MPETPRTLNDLTPEQRAQLEVISAKWNKLAEEQIRLIRESEIITGEDLAIRMTPCEVEPDGR